MKHAVHYWEPKPLDKTACKWTARVANNDLPVWIERKWGQGRMIYQPMQMAGSLCAAEGAVGKKWDFERDDALAELLHEVLGTQLEGARVWKTDAPEKIYTTLYREPARLLIHFLNGLGSSTLGKDDVMTADIAENCFPKLEADIHFSIECRNMTPGKVYAVSPDFEGRRNLEFTLENGVLTATLPAELLDVYTIVILE